MKFYKKLFSPMDRFVDPPKFFLWHILLLFLVAIGVNESIQQHNHMIHIDVMGLFMSIGIIGIDFLIINYLFGQYIFADQTIWLAQFMFWEVVDVSDSTVNSRAEMEFWCSYNCKKNSWRLTYNKWMIFKNTDDAFMFRMVW